MLKKLPGLIWIVFVIVTLERRLAPGTFGRLFSGRPTAR